MFKAIGRLGSSVRSSLNFQIFTNIFGSKSKKYGDLGNEDEEIFIDARESIDHESDTKDDTDSQKSVNIKSASSDTEVDKKNDTRDGGKSCLKEIDAASDPFTSEAEIVENNNKENEATIEVNKQCSNQTSSRKYSKENSSDVNSDAKSNKSDSDHEENNEDDHHINHKDTTKIVKTPKQDNGIVHSASSSSIVKKVHRRMNSYSQRQYAKFDNSQDDDTDNVVESTDASVKSDVHSHQVVDDDIEQSSVTKSEKKSKRKKKIAKRTRKAVRGSWKWFKRSMVAYAATFNFSSMFVVNIASAARKR